MKDNLIISLEDREKAMRYYQDKLLNLTEFFTGLASANRSQWFNSVGHAVQGLLAGEFLETLRNTMKNIVRREKLKKILGIVILTKPVLQSY